MKKLLIAGAALATLIGTPALAADLALKASPLAPAPVYTWTGFYVGLNGGYSLARDPFNQSLSLDGFFFQDSSIDSRVSPQGGVFGGQVGYNYQAGHAVFGVEGDFQWSGARDTAGCGIECVNSPDTPFTQTLGSIEQQIKWFGTARGRVGYADNGWLFYITGGGAWGRIDTTQAASESAPGIGILLADSNTTSTIKGGWVFGGGTEVRIAGPWSAKFEYFYMDLGNVTPVPLALGNFVNGVTLSSNSSVHDHIVRVGVNMKLN